MVDPTITFVLAGSDGSRMQPLTVRQPKVLAPFGGIFRILDFTLSNAINSQLRHVYVVGERQWESIQSYIRDGWSQLSKEFRWDRDEDVMSLPPARNPSDYADIVGRSRAEFVLVISGEQIYQLDYRRVLRQLAESRADFITSEAPRFTIFRREAFLKQLRHDSDLWVRPPQSARSESFNFTGYCRTVETLDDYHAANMDFLTDRPGFDPYTGTSWPVRTLSGPRYLQESRHALNSRVSLGTRLGLGSKVSSSVVSAGTRIEAGSEIEHSVILSGCHIGVRSRIRNAVIAENATIPPGSWIGFDLEADRLRYAVTPEGVVVVANSEAAPMPLIHRRCARVGTRGR